MSQKNGIAPHMPEAAVGALIDRLGRTRSYLEYGAGGSTVLAAKLGLRKIVSIDTSQEWLDNVRNDIVRLEYGGSLELHHVDIGPTKKWGYPVDDRLRKNWHEYYFLPWKNVLGDEDGFNLILIDGRFRVLCFLTSLAHAPVGATILFDDYVNRSHYHAVERIVTPIRTHDRMAEFVKSAEPRASDLLMIMADFVGDAR